MVSLAVVLSSCVTAIILEFITASSSSHLSCPSPMTPSCSCLSTPYYYELHCSAFTVRVQPQAVVHIQCTTNDVSDFSVLIDLRIGKMETLIIRHCPLPSVLLSKLTQNLGVSNVTSLTLHADDITQLPDNVFNDMPNLKHIDLKTNNVVLPKAIFSSVPKLLELELCSNNLTYLQPGVFHNLTELRSLKLCGNLRNLSKAVLNDLQNLESLDINSNNMASLPSDLFVDLINLRRMNLQENEFLSLPQNLFINNSKLEMLNLQDNRRTLNTLPSGLLANLTMLKEVKVNSCNMSTVPEDLLWGSTSVDTISLRNNTLATLPEHLFKDCNNLAILDVSFNRITRLTHSNFFTTRQLKTLLLNDNQLTVITQHLFERLDWLEILDLKNNQLTHIESEVFPLFCSIKELNMSNNLFTFEGATVSPFYICRSLEDIQLANNFLTRILPDLIYINNLKTLNLSHNQITQIKVAEFHNIVSRRIYIDVSYNNISKIDIFRDKMFNLVNGRIHMLVKGNPLINCDCNYYNFIIHSFIAGTSYSLTIETNNRVSTKSFNSDIIIETKPDNITNITKHFMCDKHVVHLEPATKEIQLKTYACLLGREFSSMCSEQCSCIFRQSDTALIIDCHQKNVTAMPEALPDIGVSNYTELILSGNRIKSVKSPLGPGYYKVTKYILSDNIISEINLTAFSHKLQVLKLDGNSIDQFNISSTYFLLSAINLTQLTLHNNPWKCDCSTKDLVTMIRRASHLKKIKPLENITCENGKTILKMSDTDMCPVEPDIIVYVSFTVAALGILFGFYYKFQDEIKVWLYAHHCCLWLISEEELDKDKEYDAFISYCHSDEDFVADYLVPGLENGPTKYKVCVHYRDWLAGEFIPAQIANSVEQSRRTIVVLSPDFLQSVWGRLEFRAAHMQALSEKRNRLIVIIYTDIGPTDVLDPELQTYLRMNTYIKWGDPLFWDKLHYAFPHSSKLHDEIPLQELT